LPILIVLAVLALPIFLLLFLFGLPIFLVFAAGALAIGVLFAALAFGVFALKIAVFVVLPLWLLWRLASWMFRGRDSREAPTPKPSEGGETA
jgi:membrane protein implicated in regulation of membrane protease activity